MKRSLPCWRVASGPSYDRETEGPVFYLSARITARFCPTSTSFYDRERAEGKSHRQSILALARRRLDDLWALVRAPQYDLAVG